MDRQREVSDMVMSDDGFILQSVRTETGYTRTYVQEVIDIDQSSLQPIADRPHQFFYDVTISTRYTIPHGEVKFVPNADIVQCRYGIGESEVGCAVSTVSVMPTKIHVRLWVIQENAAIKRVRVGGRIVWHEDPSTVFPEEED